MIEDIINYLVGNSLVMSFLFVGLVMAVSELLSKHVLQERIHSSAIAIAIGLVMAYIGGKLSGGSRGIADISIFTGVGVLGGSMFRDFTIVSASFGANLGEFKKCGKAGVIALFAGVALSFFVGMAIALAFGYSDPEDITVVAAGTVSFITGPVTASSLGVTSEVVALSIAAGVVKSISIMIATPIAAKHIGLNTPKAAIVYGAMMGSTSGISAGLAATDERLVPYGAMMATFYMGLGCLLCPTVLYWITCTLLSITF